MPTNIHRIKYSDWELDQLKKYVGDVHSGKAPGYGNPFASDWNSDVGTGQAPGWLSQVSAPGLREGDSFADALMKPDLRKQVQKAGGFDAIGFNPQQMLSDLANKTYAGSGLFQVDDKGYMYAPEFTGGNFIKDSLMEYIRIFGPMAAMAFGGSALAGQMGATTAASGTAAGAAGSAGAGVGSAGATIGGAGAAGAGAAGAAGGTSALSTLAGMPVSAAPALSGATLQSGLGTLASTGQLANLGNMVLANAGLGSAAIGSGMNSSGLGTEVGGPMNVSGPSSAPLSGPDVIPQGYQGAGMDFVDPMGGMNASGGAASAPAYSGEVPYEFSGGGMEGTGTMTPSDPGMGLTPPTDIWSQVKEWMTPGGPMDTVKSVMKLGGAAYNLYNAGQMQDALDQMYDQQTKAFDYRAFDDLVSQYHKDPMAILRNNPGYQASVDFLTKQGKRKMAGSGYNDSGNVNYYLADTLGNNAQKWYRDAWQPIADAAGLNNYNNTMMNSTAVNAQKQIYDAQQGALGSLFKAGSDALPAIFKTFNL